MYYLKITSAVIFLISESLNHSKVLLVFKMLIQYLLGDNIENVGLPWIAVKCIAISD